MKKEINKRLQVYGLVSLLSSIFLGCVSNPKDISLTYHLRSDVPYEERNFGYFTENGQKYFGNDGKRFLVQNDNGIEKRFEMKFDGKDYYLNIDQTIESK